jgi:hypothetical protein
LGWSISLRPSEIGERQVRNEFVWELLQVVGNKAIETPDFSLINSLMASSTTSIPFNGGES